MRWVCERHPLPRLLVFPLLLLTAAGLAAARFFPDLLYKFAACPWRDVTTLPCPTCGGTRAVVELVQGNLAGSLGSNPALAVGLALFLIWAVYALAATLIPAWRFRVDLGAREKKAARFLAASLIVINWLWLLKCALF